MVCAGCHHCAQIYHWHWVEAFYKFGFNDGDGEVHTEDIAKELQEHGYEVWIGKWGAHNVIIYSIRKDGIEIMPVSNSKYCIGYDDPRDYLPSEITSLLNEKFPETKEFEFWVR